MKRFVLGLGVLALSAAAYADNGYRFEYQPAELGTAQGIVETHKRIEDTARQYCHGFYSNSRALGVLASCVKDVTAEIVSKVGNRRLTAYARTGHLDDDLLAGR
ncbi:MAG: UrcA family protein [Pseudomonadales bacterium]